MLSAAELADLRADSLALLVDTCTIRRAVRASDSMGGESSTWSDLATGVACKMVPTLASNQELERQGRVTAVELWTLTLPHDQDITKLDRVVYDGRTYEVESIGADRTWQIVKRVQLAVLT